MFCVESGGQPVAAGWVPGLAREIWLKLLSLFYSLKVFLKVEKNQICRF